MAAIAASLSLPFSLSPSFKITTRSKVTFKGRFVVFATSSINGGEESGEFDYKKKSWSSLFDVEDPRCKVPSSNGKFLDVYQALEVARYDLQYCDWRARQDLLTIMLLHDKVIQKHYY